MSGSSRGRPPGPVLRLPTMTGVSVEVLHDGRWYSGWLEAVRHGDEGWRGFVRFTVDPDATQVLWFGGGEVRPPSD
jgi:hypothetical protein